MPARYARYGTAWWRTHFFLYLWRLNDAALDAVEALATKSEVRSAHVAVATRFLAT